MMPSRQNDHDIGVGAILMYHRVADENIDPWGLCVAPIHFAEQLEVIQSHFTPMTLPDLIKGIRERNLPRNPCVLTFDDGYFDNLENVKPLLERYNIPATIYITTGYTDKTREFWWDELEKIILHDKNLPETLILGIDGTEHRWNLGGCASYTISQLTEDLRKKAWEADEGTRLRLYFEIWEKLQPLPMGKRYEIFDTLREWAAIPVSEDTRRRALTSEEIFRMAESELITIGCHTVNHPRLSKLPVDEQAREIVEAQRFLRQVTERDVVHFAFPHGDFSSDTLDILTRVGMESACTVRSDTVSYTTNVLQLPRIAAPNCGNQAFYEHLVGWLAQAKKSLC